MTPLNPLPFTRIAFDLADQGNRLVAAQLDASGAQFAAAHTQLRAAVNAQLDASLAFRRAMADALAPEAKA